MGLCINYRGRLKNPDLISPLSDELVDIGKSMGWETTRLDEDFSRENTSRLVHTEKGAKIVGHLPLKGVNLSPNEGCEGVGFFFDQEGNLTSPLTMATSGPVKDELPYLPVKTQYAPIGIHIALIKLFKYLKKKYFQVFEVKDEGSYWETGDEVLLQKKMDFLAGKIDAVGKILEEADIEHDPSSSPHELADKIERLLKEKLEDLY